MRFKYSLVITVLTIVLLLIFNSCSENTIDNEADNNDIAVESALTYDATVFIGNLLAENLYNGTWGNIKLVTSCSTYDHDSKYNGKLYKVMTEESASGYIQVIYHNGEWHLAEYSFDNSDLYEKVGAKETLYYFGSGIYCTKDENNFKSLLDNKTYSKAEAENLCDTITIMES